MIVRRIEEGGGSSSLLATYSDWRRLEVFWRDEMWAAR